MAWRRFPGGRSGRRQRSATGDRPSTVDAMAYPGESALVLTAAPPPSVTGALLSAGVALDYWAKRAATVARWAAPWRLLPSFTAVSTHKIRALLQQRG